MRRPLRTMGDSWKSGSVGVDEFDAGAGVGVAIVHLAEAATTPDEVHLGNEHPGAIRGDGDHLREVATAARALFVGVKVDGGAGYGRHTTAVLGIVQDIWVGGVQLLDPPIAPAEGGGHFGVGARVGGVDGGVAVRRDCPCRDVGYEEARAVAWLPNRVVRRADIGGIGRWAGTG